MFYFHHFPEFDLPFFILFFLINLFSITFTLFETFKFCKVCKTFFGFEMKNARAVCILKKNLEYVGCIGVRTFLTLRCTFCVSTCTDNQSNAHDVIANMQFSPLCVRHKRFTDIVWNPMLCV